MRDASPPPTPDGHGCGAPVLCGGENHVWRVLGRVWCTLTATRSSIAPSPTPTATQTHRSRDAELINKLLGITFDVPASSADGTRRITGAVTSVLPPVVSSDPGRAGQADDYQHGDPGHCGKGASSSISVTLWGLLTVHTTPADTPSPDTPSEQTIGYTATLTCKGKDHEHSGGYGTHNEMHDESGCYCAKKYEGRRISDFAFDFDFKVDAGSKAVLTSAERWLLAAYELPKFGDLTPYDWETGKEEDEWGTEGAPKGYVSFDAPPCCNVLGGVHCAVLTELIVLVVSCHQVCSR